MPSSTPRSHKVLTKRACPAPWPGQSSSRPRAYAASAAAAAAAAQSVLCLPSCGCRYDAHNGKAGQQQTKKNGAAVRAAAAVGRVRLCLIFASFALAPRVHGQRPFVLRAPITSPGPSSSRLFVLGGGPGRVYSYCTGRKQKGGPPTHPPDDRGGDWGGGQEEE